MPSPRPLAPAFVLAVAAAIAGAQEPAPAEPPMNRLQHQTSPYLRQHRHNPVDWMPWGDEALARARREDKPIFLSIGYSACHWCHVMAKESFADPAIAALLNEHFVCIKVDREERPDIDEIYMGAVQAMDQQGGWPLSVWLTPDQKPFYGGTYFPPEDRFGRPGFRRVVESLAKAFRERRQDVERGAGELSAHLAKALAPAPKPGEPTADLLAKVLPQAQQRFDAEHGGFGQPPHWAPKFPPASELQALLRLGEPAADAIVGKTLSHMARGGLYDQLGGGFHRYSTDREWLVPHFEKMLYDNALLVPCLIEAHERTGEPLFGEVARETLQWMAREMLSAAGGFHATTDAQSEGVEGKYFVWSWPELTRVLGDDAAAAAAVFGASEGGNWEGTNVLWLPRGRPAGEGRAAYESARARLLRARGERVPPATDDKVVAAWHGFAISAFATGARAFGDEQFLATAQRAADFACRELIAGGRACRAWHSGAARSRGCLDDQAGLALGLLDLFEADPDPRWLAAAESLLRELVQHFGAEDGGFWFTADDHGELLTRTKNVHEGSTPSGAALATTALLRAGLLLGDEALYERGVAALRQAHAVLSASPAAAPSLVVALQFHLGEPREVVVVGPPGDAATQALLAVANGPSRLGHVLVHLHAGNRAALEQRSPVFRGKDLVDGRPAAFVCRRGVCQLPVTEAAALRRQLEEAR
jgi:uncharacterized protein